LREKGHRILVELESKAVDIAGNDWSVKLDAEYFEHAKQYRKYDTNSVQELLRLIRNQVRVQPQLMRKPFSFPLSL
jgi:hypothetical protein